MPYLLVSSSIFYQLLVSSSIFYQLLVSSSIFYQRPGPARSTAPVSSTDLCAARGCPAEAVFRELSGREIRRHRRDEFGEIDRTAIGHRRTLGAHARAPGSGAKSGRQIPRPLRAQKPSGLTARRRAVNYQQARKKLASGYASAKCPAAMDTIHRSSLIVIIKRMDCQVSAAGYARAKCPAAGIAGSGRCRPLTSNTSNALD